MKAIKSNRLRFLGSISKYALGIGIIAVPLTASAFDFTPDSTRLLSDPAYLPLQGQIEGTSQYSYADTNWTTDNDVGALDSTNKHKESTVTQTFGYGVTDDFTIQVSDNYDWIKAKSVAAAGTETDSNSTGFADPTIGATWRALDEKTYPLNWDFIATYAPNLINSKSASTTEDGTVARGGQTAGGGTALSYETKSFTISGRGTATYLGDRDTLNQSNNITTDYNSSWQYQLAVNTQTRFTDLWSVNAGVTETFNTTADATILDTPAKDITTKPGDTTALNAALNFQVIPNRLAASLIDTYTFYGNGHTDYVATPASDTSVVSERANTISVALRYAF